MIYTREYYSAPRKKGMPPFAKMWMDAKGIMLSEVSPIEKDKYYVSLICGFLKN